MVIDGKGARNMAQVHQIFMGTLSATVERVPLPEPGHAPTDSFQLVYQFRTAGGDKFFATFFGRMQDTDCLRDNADPYTWYFRHYEGPWYRMVLTEMELLTMSSLEELFAHYREAKRHALSQSVSE